uniref:leucine-rich repeat protein n=1 Tax=Prevotella sp. TaxID=59823 RepID=UPI0040279147
MKKLFTLQKGRVLLLVLMLCLGFSKVQADDSGLITEQVKINVVEAGTLCDRIKSDLKYKITSLKLSGKLNIDDILYIREMAGCYYDTKGSKYDGHLEDLDISDVTLIGTDKDVDVYFYTTTNGSTPTGGSFSADLRTPQTLGNGLFAYLPMLRSVILPKKVQAIGFETFLMCSQLTSVTLPSDLTAIWGYAFSGCTSLHSMQFPSSLTSINACAFQDCTSLVSLQFPSGLTSIGHNAFYGCTSLTSLQFPSNLTSIGNSAFAGCKGLTSLQFPSGLTFIGGAAFEDCTSLVSLQLPSGLTSIGSAAFENCTSLVSLQLPSGLTSIGSAAFAYCSGLTTLQFPSGLTSIGVRAFQNCTGLTSLELPSGLTKIEEGAFWGCSNINSIYAYMPDPLLFDGEAKDFPTCFNENCTLYVPKKSYTAYIVAPGWGDFKTIAKFNPDLIRDWVTKNVAQAGTLSTVIGEDKENITKLKLTGNLNDTDVQYLEEMIREAALLELNLKDALLYTINVCRFSDCKSLTSLVLPDVLQRIEKAAFSNCTGLTTISLPAGLEYMYAAFDGNIGLTSIYANMPTPLQDAYSFDGLDKSNCYLYVPKGSLDAYRQDWEWGSFPYIAGLERDSATGLFSLEICPNGYRDYELIDVAMRDKVKSLKISGAVDFGFINQYLSSNLQNLDLKDANVTDLPYCGLDRCQDLTTISLPAGLRSIDKGFLSNCRNLRTIYAYMPDPNALIYEDNFYYESREWTLYVPKGMKNAYQNSKWRYCKEIIEMETSGIDSVILNPDAKEVSRFSADGQRLAVPVKGLNIVKYSDGSARKVVVK